MSPESNRREASASLALKRGRHGEDTDQEATRPIAPDANDGDNGRPKLADETAARTSGEQPARGTEKRRAVIIQMDTAVRKWLRPALQLCTSSIDDDDVRASSLDVPAPPRGAGEIAVREEDVHSDRPEAGQDRVNGDGESISGGDDGCHVSDCHEPAWVACPLCLAECCHLHIDEHDCLTGRIARAAILRTVSKNNEVQQDAPTRTTTSEHSAGCVPIRSEGDMPESLLLRCGKSFMGLPKGKIKRGEDDPHAAERVLREEAGSTSSVEVGPRIGRELHQEQPMYSA